MRLKRKKKEITQDDVVAWEREGNVKKLRKALTSPDVSRDTDAARAGVALCKLGDRESVAPIVQLLHSGRLTGDFDQTELLLAFGELAGPDAIPALIYALEESPSDHVHQVAATALDRLGDETVEPLIRTLGSAQYLDSRRWAAQLLGSRGDSRAVEPLRAALDAPNNDDPGIRSVLNLSLEELGGSERRADP